MKENSVLFQAASWISEQWKNVTRFDESYVFYSMWSDSSMCVTHLWKEWERDAPWEERPDGRRVKAECKPLWHFTVESF